MNIKSTAINSKLIVALAVLMLAGVAWGQTNYVSQIDTNAPIQWVYSESFIRALAKSGAICAALGFHCWGTDWESVVQFVYYPDGQPQSRKCRICGEVETKQPGAWK